MSEHDEVGDDEFFGEDEDGVPFLEMLEAFDQEIMFGISFCNSIVHRMVEMFGEESIVDLVCAADRAMGWSSEIVANRSEVDNLLFDKYGAFDDNLWTKVQQTKSWDKMHRQLYKMTRKYLASAVDEVVQSEVSHRE